MELRDLRYFCVTAELEHVTKAAEQLNIAQPYLTRVIHQIEDEAGGELFHKEGRRIKLNGNGKMFYKYAKRVLADMELLHTQMDYIFERKQQTITLLCNTETFSEQMIKAFNKVAPGYTLSILQATTREMLDALNQGKAQFALSCPPLRSLGDYCMVETVDVFSLAGYAMLPPGHPLIERRHIDIQELRNENLITMPIDSAMRNTLQPVFDGYNVHPKIVLESSSLGMITQAVKEGLGFAFVAELHVIDFPEMIPYVVTVNPRVKAHYGLSYNKYAVESRHCEQFKNFALEFFSDLQKRMSEQLLTP